MFADSIVRAFFRNSIIWTGFLLLIPLQTARAGVWDNPKWHNLKTRHTIIRYSNMGDLFKLNQMIQYYPRDTGVKSLTGLKDVKTLSQILKKKVDALYERAQEILDMRKQVKTVVINVYPNKKALDAAYYAIFKEECPLRAWYLFEKKMVYINVEDVHEGMLAHEMGHHIIDHFFKVRPPETTAEILARYIDAHLYR
jgi:hypothetical protein